MRTYNLKLILGLLLVISCSVGKKQVIIKLPKEFSGWIYVIGDSLSRKTPLKLSENVYSIPTSEFTSIKSVQFYKGDLKVDQHDVKLVNRSYHSKANNTGHTVFVDDMIEVLAFYICDDSEAILPDNYWANPENYRKYNSKSSAEIDSLIGINIIK